MPVIQSTNIIPVSFPLKNPFVTAAGHKTRTDNVQIIIRLSDGTRGKAEASSSIAMPDQSQKTMKRVLQTMAHDLGGQPIETYRSLIARCWRHHAKHPTATAAMECALLDVYTRWTGQSLSHFLGGEKTIIETDFTLSVGSPDDLYRSAKAATRRGFRRLKVKLSGHAQKDHERVRAVRKAAPRTKLVADGNQGFRLSEALAFGKQVIQEKIPVVFFEQPFPRHDLRSARLFRKQCWLPLLADESVRTAADAERVFKTGAADGVNIKIAKSGILGALEIIRVAKRFKKRLSIGCMEESKLGLAASVHLACGTGVFDWVDLDSVFLLDSRPLRGGFTIRGPHLSVRGIGPGIGM
ncbi:MAG: dipeptide epimerase [Elusimicrobiota bacterium]